jgi:3-oxoacid CoA-transferase
MDKSSHRQRRPSRTCRTGSGRHRRFGVAHRFANSLILACARRGSKDLTIVCNSLGDPGAVRGQILAENKQIKKLIAAFSVRPARRPPASSRSRPAKWRSSWCRRASSSSAAAPGGAGIPAFYSPTSVGTDLVKGPRDPRVQRQARMCWSPPINVDYALLRGYRAIASATRSSAAAARTSIPASRRRRSARSSKVDEIVEPGTIPPDLIDLPGYLREARREDDAGRGRQGVAPPERRPSDKPRLYSDKPAVTRQGIAKNAARLVAEGTYVNLGVGIPTMVSNYLRAAT